MNDEPKRAAVGLDELGDRRLSEISAAEFLQVLEQAEASEAQTGLEDVTVRDAVAGARAGRIRFHGGLPEKKKLELEKQQLEKQPEKLAPEKVLVEGFPEKKKLELEKAPWFEGPIVKVKADNEQPIEFTELAGLAERLTAIEQKLSQRSP